MSETKGMRLDELLGEMTWVRALALALARDAHTADELVQETWIRLLQSPDVTRQDMQNTVSLRARVRATMRGLWLHDRRAARRRKRREENAAANEAQPSTYDVVAACALRQEVAETVMGLEEPYRETLLHRYFEDLAMAEIAARMDTSEETVRQRLHRGRERLRAALERRLGENVLEDLLALFPLPLPPRSGMPRWFMPLAAASVLGLVGVRFGLAQLEELYGVNDGSSESSVPESPRYASDNNGVTPARDDRGLPLWDLTTPARAPLPARHAGIFGFFTKIGDEERLEQALEREFITLDELKLDPSRARKTAEGAGIDPQHMRGVRLWKADVKNQEGEGSKPGLVASCALAQPFKGAELIALFGSSEAQTLVAVGSPTLDADADHRWGAFLSQLLRAANQGQSDEELLSADEARDRSALFEEEGEDAELARALQAQLRVMRANMQYGTAWFQLEQEGQLPPAAWTRELAEQMRGLAASAESFDPVLGPNDHERHAQRLVRVADMYAALAEEIELDSFRELHSDMGRSCSRCHRARAAEAGSSWMGAFRPWHETLELSRKALRVGMDLAPAMGDDGVGSQQIAQAFRVLHGVWRTHRSELGKPGSAPLAR